MTDDMQMLNLNFELEGEEDGTDLERSAVAVRDGVSALPGVEDAHAEVSDDVRVLDLVTAGAIVVGVKYVISNSADIVKSLDELVIQLKQLARDLGLPHLKVWVHREKIDADDLTPEKLRELAAKSAPAKT